MLFFHFGICEPIYSLVEGTGMFPLEHCKHGIRKKREINQNILTEEKKNHFAYFELSLCPFGELKDHYSLISITI